MAQEPCSPEDIERLANLLNQGAHKEIHVIPLDPVIVEIPQSASEAMTNAKMAPWFPWLRTQRGGQGDEMSATALNELAIVDNKANNFVGKYFSRFNEIIRPLVGRGLTGYLRGKFIGIPRELDDELYTILEGIEKGGKIIDPTLSTRHSAEKIEVGVKIRAIFDELFTKLNLDPGTYIHGYMPRIKAKPEGMFARGVADPQDEAWLRTLTPEQLTFVHELDRSGHLMDTEPRLSTVFSAYLHSAANAKIRKPAIQEIEKSIVHSYYNVKYVSIGGVPHITGGVGFRAWKELVHSVLGGVTPRDRQLTSTFQDMASRFGYKTDLRGTYYFSNMASNMFYSGVLGSPIGGRPASIVRQLTQLTPTYAEMGARLTRQAIQDVMKDLYVDGTPMITRFREQGLMSSHIDSLIASVDVAKGVGKSVSAITDASMKLFSSADMFTRAVTARGAELRFNEYLAKDMIDKLPGRKELTDNVIKIAATGNIDKARSIYQIDAVNNLQYFYGKANRPEWMRGAIGHLAGIFMSYPLNTFEMMRIFTKRAIKGAAQGYKEGGVSGIMEHREDWLPLMRLTVLTGLMMEAGSEFLDADLSSMFVIGAMPHSMAFPKGILDTWNAGSSTVEWQLGNIFQTGETDFHRQNRLEYYHNSGKFAKNFLPGIGAFDDLSKVVDEGSIARFLALTPKGDILNQQRKDRLRQERAVQSVLGKD